MEFKPEIIYEDNHLLIINKPQNVAVQEDESKDPDLLNLLKQFIKNRDNKPNNVYLGLVHRLDRPTGGVMVFAKTSKCAERLSKQLRDHSLKKSYLCIVVGQPESHQGRLQTYLVKDEKTNTVNLATLSDFGAKEAILDYKVLSSKSDLSLVEVELKTGRSHQIRVQMSKQNKTPVFGDFKYGDKIHKSNLALWAYKLEFVHPTTKNQMIFKSMPNVNTKPWKDFENIIQDLF